ncbi:MAG: AMMECR1 domain-containing protein [bacterium]|nr:AMMECR1 domain-containing protein [bacterium]
MLGGFFKKFTEQADDFYHSHQIEEFFAWLHSSVPPKDQELVFLNLPLQEELLDSRTRQRGRRDSGSILAFVFCEPGQLDSSLKKLDRPQDKVQWYLVFYAAGIEIWENPSRHSKALPIRLGVGKEEKSKLLSFSRKCMEDFFKEPTIHILHNTNGEDLMEGDRVSVDVALWINGSLRGSIIVENQSLYEAIKRASLGALRDNRMKPVEEHELAQALIEITVFSNLRLPLRKADITDFNIDGRRGYYVANEGKRGWYLPAVFNCVKFKGMAHMRESLIREKAKISRDMMDKVQLYAFMVEGFIEGRGGRVLLLEGTVAFEEVAVEDSWSSFIEEAHVRGDLAAEWVMTMQDKDGFMPLYADPLCSSFGRIDWARLACTTHALSCYGQVTRSEPFQKGARNTLSYLSRHLLEVSTIAVNVRIPALVYLARAAMVLKEETVLSDIMTQIPLYWRSLNYQPILAANMATLFALQAIRSNGAFLAESIELAEQVFADFKIKYDAAQRIQLAEYPELAHALDLLHQITGKDVYAKKAQQVKEWLIEQQFENGAFPSYTNSWCAYTRGTGKIFEALTGIPASYEKAVKSSFYWLVRMQYGEHNMYFVPLAFRNRVDGGLRHDHANSEAWIDAAAHFLLGISRIISRKHDPEIHS